MGVHDELCVTRRCTMKILRLQFYIVLLISLLSSSSYFIGCTTSAPDGSSPRVYSRVFALGCTCRLNFSYFDQLCIFFLSIGHLIRSIAKTSDKSSPEHMNMCLHLNIGSRNFCKHVLLQLSKFFFQLYFAPPSEVFQY
jgi:hypothetical protein